MHGGISWELAGCVHRPIVDSESKGGSFSQKLSQLTPLSKAKRANPRYFILLCGISSELAGCVHRPIVDSESGLAAKLNFFKTPVSGLPFPLS